MTECRLERIVWMGYAFVVSRTVAAITVRVDVQGDGDPEMRH